MFTRQTAVSLRHEIKSLLSLIRLQNNYRPNALIDTFCPPFCLHELFFLLAPVPVLGHLQHHNPLWWNCSSWHRHILEGRITSMKPDSVFNRKPRSWQVCSPIACRYGEMWPYVHTWSCNCAPFLVHNLQHCQHTAIPMFMLNSSFPAFVQVIWCRLMFPNSVSAKSQISASHWMHQICGVM